MNKETFKYQDIIRTYTPTLTASSILLTKNGPWSWNEEQDNFRNVLNASERPYLFTMIYNPANASDEGIPMNGGFPKEIYGKKQNYNTMLVDVNIYVTKATYVESKILGLLSSFHPNPYSYKVDLMVADLNMELPEGFTFKDPTKKLYFGTNECALIYNAGSTIDPNYLPYGENASEKINIKIDINQPQLRGTLSPDRDIYMEVEQTGDNRFVIKRDYGQTVGEGRESIPYVVSYYDEYLQVWVEVNGTASWVDGSEKLLSVGYISKELKFVPVDKNLIGNRDYRTFDVQIMINQVDIDTSLIAFSADKQYLTYQNLSTLFLLSKLKVDSSSPFNDLQDVYYTYKQVLLNPDGSIVEESLNNAPTYELKSSIILNSNGDANNYGSAYIIVAHFDRGNCVYYNFGDYSPSTMLYIARAQLDINIENVTKTYGDKTISGDIDEFNISGLQDLDSSLYTFGIYDKDNRYVYLNYKTNVGEYKIQIDLTDSAKANYTFDSSEIVATYTILQQEIPDYVVLIDGLLRENGTRLNDRISLKFDESYFVDGIIPEYEIHFTKDGKEVGSVISQGTYYITVVFVDGNYSTSVTRSFVVYESQSYMVLIVSAIAVAVITLVAFVVVGTVKVNRRKYKKSIQQQQFKKIKQKVENQDDSDDDKNFR